MEYILTKDNFNEIINSDKAVLVDFYADWCGPCKMMMPIVDSIAKENITVGKINVDNEPEIAEKYGVMSIPTFAIFRDGVLSEKITGITKKEILMQKLS